MNCAGWIPLNSKNINNTLIKPKWKSESERERVNFPNPLSSFTLDTCYDNIIHA